MTFFNSKNLALVFVIGGLLSACGGRRDNTNDRATFRVERVSIDSSVPGLADQSGIVTGKSWRFKACISSAASLDTIKNANFGISDGTSQLQAATDNGGCLNWTETHPVDISMDEHFVKFTRTITGLDAFTGSVEVQLAMDPWRTIDALYYLNGDHQNPENQFDPSKLTVAVVDQALSFNATISPLATQSFTAPFVSVPGAKQVADDSALDPIDADMVVMNFYGLDKEHSQIDPLLTLKTVEQYELSISPKWAHRGLDGILQSTMVSTSRFHVGFVLVRANARIGALKPSDVVAHYVNDIQANSQGEIEDHMSLLVDDMSAMLSRTQLLVFLQPQGDAARHFRAGFFVGHVNGFQFDKGIYSGIVGLLDVKEEQRLPDLANLLAVLDNLDQPVPRALDMLAAEKNVIMDTAPTILDLSKHPNLQDPTLTKGMRDGFCDKFYTDQQTIEKKHTILTYLNKTDRQVCHEDPMKYVVLDQRDFVEKMDGDDYLKSLGVTMNPEQITISHTSDETQTNKATTGDDVKANAGLGLNFDLSKWLPSFFSVKFGLGADWYYTNASERVSSTTNEAKIVNSETLWAVGDTYQLKVIARACLTAHGTMDGPMLLSCSSTTFPETIQESYYVISHSVTNSLFTDNAEENSLRMVIRGKEEFQAFQKLMGSGNTILQTVGPAVPPPNMQASLIPPDSALKVTQTYYGMISKQQPLPAANQ